MLAASPPSWSAFPAFGTFPSDDSATSAPVTESSTMSAPVISLPAANAVPLLSTTSTAVANATRFT